MHDCPLAASPHPNRDRLHEPAAIGGSIAWLDVQMLAMKAVGAMVSVLAARADEHNVSSAVGAFKMIVWDAVTR